MNALRLVLAILFTLTLAACGTNRAPESRPLATQAVTLTDFNATPNPVDIGEEIVFTWSVSHPDSATLTCTLDPGDGSSSRVIDDCAANSSAAYTFYDLGTFTATLTVDDGTSQETSSLQVTVDGSETQIPFSDAEAQAAWSLITSTPEMSTYNLAFNTAEAVVLQSESSITFAVPEHDAYSYVVAGVVDGAVASILRYNFNFDTDELYVTNILDFRNVTVENVSQISDDDLDALAATLKPLFLNPAFDVPTAQSTALAGQGKLSPQSTCNSGSCENALVDYQQKVDVYAARTAKTADGLIRLLGIAPIGPGVACQFIGVLGGGVLKTALTACTYATLSTVGWILSANAAITAYQAVFNCTQSNDPTFDSGTALIAVVSPPLPFSYQVFVQSVPEQINLASGYLRPGYSDQDVYNLLDSAVPNAEFVWESYSGTQVIPDATQLDVRLQSISTTYATALPAPLCIP